MSDANILMGGNGAIPRLGESLQIPVSGNKAKTNVAKAKLLGMALLGIITVLIGLMSFGGKASAPKATEQPNPKLQKAAYEINNTEIDSQTVRDAKARIKKEEEERLAAEMAEMEAKMQQAQSQQEQIIAAMNANNAAQGNIMAATDGREPSTEQTLPELADDPVARKLRAGVLVSASGHIPTPFNPKNNGASSSGNTDGGMSAVGNGGNFGNGGIGSASFGGNQEEIEAWKEAEIKKRRKAAGLDPSGDSDAFIGGATLGGGGASLGSRLHSASLSAVSAEKLGNLDYILRRGTAIPCATTTGIDTQLPGMVVCRAINDVYSANGKTLLVERGATFYGEQQSGIQRGQDRTFIVWSRGDNPSGITFQIDSPGTDSLGTSGLPGTVNRHLLERFGGAILVSLIDDFAKGVTKKMSERNSITIGESAADSTSALAQKTLDESINIPSNLVIKPGTVIYILAARDVTFENVYELVR